MARKKPVQVQCPKCRKKMSEKSLKRHMDDHENISHPCKYCNQTFSQKSNRDNHQRNHTNDWLMCDSCHQIYKQHSELTRHKQDKHGHPRKGDKDANKKKISHSEVTRSEDGSIKRKAPTRRSQRSSPYPVPERKSVQPSPTSTSSFDGLSSFESTAKSSFTASLTPLSLPYQNPTLDMACPFDLNVPQCMMSQSPPVDADGLYMPEWNLYSGDCTGIGSLFCPPQDLPSDNYHHEFQGLSELTSSMPGPSGSFGEQDFFTPAERPTMTGTVPSRYPSPFHHEFTLPAGAQLADSLEEGHPTGNGPFQTEASEGVVYWESLSSEDQLAFIAAHPNSLEPGALAPPPISSDDPTFFDYYAMSDWMGLPPQDDPFLNFSGSMDQDPAGQYYRF